MFTDCHVPKMFPATTSSVVQEPPDPLSTNQRKVGPDKKPVESLKEPFNLNSNLLILSSGKHVRACSLNFAVSDCQRFH